LRRRFATAGTALTALPHLARRAGTLPSDAQIDEELAEGEAPGARLIASAGPPSRRRWLPWPNLGATVAALLSPTPVPLDEIVGRQRCAGAGGLRRLVELRRPVGQTFCPGVWFLQHSGRNLTVPTRNNADRDRT
jgi:hypothetical protein